MDILAINYAPNNNTPTDTIVEVDGLNYRVLYSSYTPEEIVGLPNSTLETDPSAFIPVPTPST